MTLSLVPAYNFKPFGTVAVLASNSSTDATFTTSKSIGAESVMVDNSGTQLCFVAFGTDSATAAAPTTETQNATPVAGGAIMVLRKGAGANKVAAITASGASTVYFTAGEGQ